MIDLFNALLGREIPSSMEWIVYLIGIAFVMVVVIKVIDILIPWKR
jgi:hypothetical protein